MVPADATIEALPRHLAEQRFARLYREHARELFRYALRRCPDREDAADVVAETFLIAWRRLADVPAGDESRLWLFGTARRVLANQRRGERRRGRLTEQLRAELRSERPAEAGETPSEVLEALAALGEDDRELLMLVGWEELTPGQAARILGISSLAARSRLHRARRRLREKLAERRVAAGLVSVLVLIAAFALTFSGGDGRDGSRAYAAELVRFAESSPLLLLEAPGWRVQNANEERRREGVEGTMEFVTGKPIPYESLTMTGSAGAPRVSGMQPPSMRQRRVELWWHHGTLADAISMQRRGPHPHGQRWVRLPVLGTTATVDTRAEFFVNQGGPGNRRMVAFWREDGYVLQLTAAVPDLAAFEERLGWLTKVDTQSWLDAMPAKVVKAADRKATIREMLEGIPVPDTFKPSLIPDDGLTTARYHVGNQVAATVSCLWFLQWAEARREGDRGAELEAERAMATSKDWGVLREISSDGGFPQTIWQLAEEMPSGVWEHTGHRYPLLPRAESLGCARLGLPLLPRKQKLQRERGPPLPPR